MICVCLYVFLLLAHFFPFHFIFVFALYFSTFVRFRTSLLFSSSRNIFSFSLVSVAVSINSVCLLNAYVYEIYMLYISINILLTWKVQNERCFFTFFNESRMNPSKLNSNLNFSPIIAKYENIGVFPQNINVISNTHVMRIKRVTHKEFDTLMSLYTCAALC